MKLHFKIDNSTFTNSYGFYVPMGIFFTISFQWSKIHPILRYVINTLKFKLNRYLTIVTCILKLLEESKLEHASHACISRENISKSELDTPF